MTAVEEKRLIQMGEKNIEITLNKFAKQADGSLMISCGGTSILCTVVVDQEPSDEERLFFPLSVFYIEKSYASGKIPGGFIKREGRPSEKEILVSRVIDRSLRPMFDPSFCMPVTVFCTLLSYSGEDVELLSVLGASIACGLAGLPMISVVAGFRVGMDDNGFTAGHSVVPTGGEKLDLFVSGTNDSIIMVESKAKELSEDEMVSALMFAQDNVVFLVEAADAIIAEFGKERIDFEVPDDSGLYKELFQLHADEFKRVLATQGQKPRTALLKTLRKKIADDFVAAGHKRVAVVRVMDQIEKNIVRTHILKTKTRMDGRGLKDIRNITAEVNILSKECVHGSALFTRGETQALVATTLGTSNDEQMLDGVSESGKERFMLHYNFPSFATGEGGPARSPGRREIGHGKLAWKAIDAVMPTHDEFPYSIRVVSEILESNGSSSMATVCGVTLSLLSTGVPLKSPVSGIAMGLIKDGGQTVVLTDIVGDEDHLGDMDFKVARTSKGITALQMDIKIAGVDINIMTHALKDAKDACLFILDKINSTIDSPAMLGDFVPKVEEIQIPVSKISELIGKQGVNIKEICNATDSKIDIDPDGKVRIFAKNSTSAELAKEMIANITSELKVGAIYSGVVEKIMPFGALVALQGKKMGMVHISEIANERIENVSDYLSEGSEVNVKVIGFDDRRRVKLSIKQALHAEGGDSVALDVDTGMLDGAGSDMASANTDPQSFFGMVNGINSAKRGSGYPQEGGRRPRPRFQKNKK